MEIKLLICMHKMAADARFNASWADAADASTTRQLSKTRRVVLWMAEGVWPNSKALGKVPGKQVAKVAAGKQATGRGTRVGVEWESMDALSLWVLEEGPLGLSVRAAVFLGLGYGVWMALAMVQGRVRQGQGFDASTRVGIRKIVNALRLCLKDAWSWNQLGRVRL